MADSNYGSHASRRRALRYIGWNWDQINTLQGIERQQALATWEWAAVRFSSLGTAQARHFDRYGAESTFQRINCFRAWLGLESV